MKKIFLILALCLISFSSLLSNDEIRYQYIVKDCIIGEEVSFAIIVVTDKPCTEDMSSIKYNDSPISFERNSTVSSMQSYVNGKFTSSQNYKTTFVFTFSPINEGKIDLTGLTFKINDKSHQLPNLTFNVNALPVSDNFKFYINIKNKRDYYYPSELVEVEVVLVLKNYKDFINYVPVITGFNWLESEGLQYVPEPKLNQKVNINNKVFAINLRKNSNTMNFDNSHSINSYLLNFKVLKPGEYSIENCRSKALVWTGRYLKSNRFSFSGQMIQDMESVELYAICPPMKFTVKDVPEKNKPEDFSGAIGDFNIEVITSNDTDLKVGDPITLNVNIVGEGAWELVQCPALQKLSAITDFFRIGSDMPVGEVVKENEISRKEFKVKLRVKSAAIKEIPSIPFSYFDIAKGQYITKYSKAIPIKVFENNNKVEVITFENKENNQNQNELNGINDVGETANTDLPLKPIEIMSVFRGELLALKHNANLNIIFVSFIFVLVPFLIVVFSRIIRSGAVENLQTEAVIKKANKKCVEKLTLLIKNINEGDSIHKKIGEILEEFFKTKYFVNTQFPGLDKEMLQNLISIGNINKEAGEQLLLEFEKWEDLKFSKGSYSPEKVLGVIKSLKDVVLKC